MDQKRKKKFLEYLFPLLMLFLLGLDPSYGWQKNELSSWHY